MKYYIFVVAFVICIMNIPSVFAEDSYIPEKPRTFKTCYNESVANLIIWEIGSPTEIDLLDPQVTSYLTNFCNFYHDKLGEWITLSLDKIHTSEQTENDLLSKEFQSMFTVPDSIIQAASGSEGILRQLITPHLNNSVNSGQ